MKEGVIIYINDMLIGADSKNKASLHMLLALDVLESLVFVIRSQSSQQHRNSTSWDFHDTHDNILTTRESMESGGRCTGNAGHEDSYSMATGSNSGPSVLMHPCSNPSTSILPPSSRVKNRAVAHAGRLQSDNHLDTRSQTGASLVVVTSQEQQRETSEIPSIACWVKSTLSNTGIDTTEFSAHSIRGVSTPKAIDAGVTLSDVIH